MADHSYEREPLINPAFLRAVRGEYDRLREFLEGKKIPLRFGSADDVGERFRQLYQQNYPACYRLAREVASWPSR